VSSNVAECRYFTKFKWPHFGTVSGCSHMVGHNGSITRIVHVDITLTRFKWRSRSQGF